ncbi:MAG: CinA family nicotinamide mononucleotide deamidase-related protein [Myxococcales bacterium]|nr:CinA family nicotinamide mononucleotide deamidase-related protein [Myxococcales bacterium]
MRVEVLCTGDELLTGLTPDTNGQYFAERLLESLGIRLARITTVGDEVEDIESALRELSARADAVLVSGGLGPTADDRTAEAAARAQGVALVEDGRALEHIRRRFAERGVAFTPNNARQALVPQGAEAIINPVGTAPMLVQRLGRCTLFYLPGVPSELRHLVERQVLPRLRELAAGEGKRTFRALGVLKTVGLPESHLDALVAPVVVRHPKVEFGFRTHAPENHLKLLAEGEAEHVAIEALEAAAADCREVLRRWLFAEDEDTLPGVLAEALRARGQTVAVAESITGGLVCQLLTEPAGATAYFKGGVVAYHDILKRRWAHVSKEALSTGGAVSAEVARQMARGIREELSATYGLSLTGFAGPDGGTEADPVGTVYLALAFEGGEEHERSLFRGSRERVRQFAAHTALDILRRRVLGGG